MTIVIGVVLTLGSVAMITVEFQSEKVHLIMGVFYIPLGLATVLFSGMTLKYHRVA